MEKAKVALIAILLVLAITSLRNSHPMIFSAISALFVGIGCAEIADWIVRKFNL